MEINKIVYFDSETISNILQDQDNGKLTSKTDEMSSLKTEGNVSGDIKGKVNLGVPFLARLEFLINGKLDVSYIKTKDKLTTLSSSEISDFNRIKGKLVCFPNVTLADIENSSTSIRVAAGYLRIIKGGIEDLDTKEFKRLMDSYDGYDTYKIKEKTFVRFNNEAFVSNYKRNDLLLTNMTLYCIKVGDFNVDRFDYIKEISQMEKLIKTAEKPQPLADMFPPFETKIANTKNINNTISKNNETTDSKVELYDVVYASIQTGDKSGE